MAVGNQFEIPNGLVCKVTTLNDKKASRIAKARERLRCGVTETAFLLKEEFTCKTKKVG